VGQAILVIGGFILLYLAASVLKSVLSRGLDKVFDAGRKVVDKEWDAEVDQVAAVPLVMTSAASVAEIVSSLDAIIQPKKAPSTIAATIYESERTADKITYAWGTAIYPQWFVAEVRFGERDGRTQVVFKCLQLPVTNQGNRTGAETLMLFRHTVEFAVDAAGDPDKIAQGVQMYGRPEAGSPRAVANRNKRIVALGGLAAFIFLALKATQAGKTGGALPYVVVLILMGVGLFIWQRKERRDISTGAFERSGLPSTAGSATADGAPTAAPSPVAGAAASLGSGASSAVAWASHPSRKNKLILAAVAVALMVFTGFALSNARSALSAIMPGLAMDQIEGIPGGTGGGYASEDYVEPEAVETERGTNPRFIQLTDMTPTAPNDGSATHAIVTFRYVNVDMEAVGFEIPGEFVGRPQLDSPCQAEAFMGDFGDGECFVDDTLVPVDEFLAFIGNRSETLGSIDFTQDGIVKAKAYSDDFYPAGGY
jgi:hypothetical protein